MWNNQKQQNKLFSFMTNLQTYYHFQLDFQNVDQHTGGSGWSSAPNATRTISCKAWNSPVECPIRECKYGITDALVTNMKTDINDIHCSVF